ncbi:MAG: formylglycine-generating enzyme family protein [Elusimicrobiota bacterium]
MTRSTVVAAAILAASIIAWAVHNRRSAVRVAAGGKRPQAFETTAAVPPAKAPVNVPVKPQPKTAESVPVQPPIAAKAVIAAATGAAPGKAGILWISIPGGTFTMGSDSGASDEKPRHRVTVWGFQMAKTLVTNKQYKICVDAGACAPPAHQDAAFDGDDQPVVGVDWNQAKAFSEWAGGRLPTEAEWEYAARGAGKDVRYPWGDEPATCERAVIRGCATATAPVCSRPAGNTEQGLCDMAGDAWEWVQDWYHLTYIGAPEDGSAWEDEDQYRAVRSSSWSDDAAAARATLRSHAEQDFRNRFLGFRPVR